MARARRRPPRAQADGAASTLRETVWLSGDEDPPRPPAATSCGPRDRSRCPTIPGFLDAIHAKGVAVTLRASTVERLGGSPNPFVRATQAVRSTIGSVDRGGVPGAGGRVAHGSRARRRLAPRRRASSATSRPPGSHTCSWSRRQRRDGARPDARARDDAGAARGAQVASGSRRSRSSSCSPARSRR